MFIGVVYGYFSSVLSWYMDISQIINLKLIKFTWLQFNIQALSLNNHTNPIPRTGPLCFLLRKPMSKKGALLVTKVGCMNAKGEFSASHSTYDCLQVLFQRVWKFISYCESPTQEHGHLHAIHQNTAHLHCIVLADVIICNKMYGDRGIYAFRHSSLSFWPKW